MKSLSLTNEQLGRMTVHANKNAPLEACGLLAGLDSKVESVIEVTNQVQSAVRFVMNPIEQLKAFEWIESNHLNLVGIFHSHPAGPETPSATDVAESAYAVVCVILSRKNGTWIARGFWIENGSFSEIPLQIG